MCENDVIVCGSNVRSADVCYDVTLATDVGKLKRR
jgi:hypothetical protein